MANEDANDLETILKQHKNEIVRLEVEGNALRKKLSLMQNQIFAQKVIGMLQCGQINGDNSSIESSYDSFSSCTCDTTDTEQSETDSGVTFENETLCKCDTNETDPNNNSGDNQTSSGVSCCCQDESSLLSIGSNQIQTMLEIKKMSEQQKLLKKNINELKLKEKELQNQMATSLNCTQSASNYNTSTNYMSGLQLSNEIKKLNKQMQDCVDNIEGSIKAQLEEEQEKSRRLEQQLEEFRMNIIESQNQYQNDVNEMKETMHSTCAKIYDLTSKNTTLNDKIVEMQNECDQLRNDLIRQKINEGEMLKKFVCK